MEWDGEYRRWRMGGRRKLWQRGRKTLIGQEDCGLFPLRHTQGGEYNADNAVLTFRCGSQLEIASMWLSEEDLG